jgi:cellulose synthase/poly-beta-1,6-N-acetylglucosamine synthase-like glycosyltransferase
MCLSSQQVKKQRKTQGAMNSIFFLLLVIALSETTVADDIGRRGDNLRQRRGLTDISSGSERGGNEETDVVVSLSERHAPDPPFYDDFSGEAVKGKIGDIDIRESDEGFRLLSNTMDMKEEENNNTTTTTTNNNNNRYQLDWADEDAGEDYGRVNQSARSFIFIKDDVTPWEVLLVAALLFPVSLLNLYGFAKFLNVVRAILATRFFTDSPKIGGLIVEGEEPVVTIQICSFNEISVVEKTIDAACEVDWPKDKLFVQICDDSTDQTIVIIDTVCARWRAAGVNCERLSRAPDRTGYKAGCLFHHTKRIKGDFVAMFDADHRCEKQFLRRTVPHFFDEKGLSKDNIGLVQVPWAYYNTHRNILTEYDCLGLDISHVIEQTGRGAYLNCFGFNGTGGIWRKDAIQAGGGWSWDTITEDLDLSYLAHFSGYDFIYLRDIPQQLEVPTGIRAHVQQKHRWTKGFFQVARKHLWGYLFDPRASLAIKFETVFHLTAATSYPLTLWVFILVPVVSYFGLMTRFLLWFTVASFFVYLAAGIITIYGKVAGSNGHYKSFWQRTTRLIYLPTLLLLGNGMMIFETFAIFDGILSDDATFLRTPKEGADGSDEVKGLYLDEMDDNDDDDESGNTRSVVSDKDEEEVSKHNVLLSREKPRFFKKHSKFLKDLALGLAGISFVIYLTGWACILYLTKEDATNARQETHGLVLVFATLIPAFGLSYIHGRFLYDLLSAKYSKIRRKAEQKRRRGRGETRRRRRRREMTRRNAIEYAPTTADQKQDLKVVGRENVESYDKTSKTQTLSSLYSAGDRSEPSRTRRSTGSFDQDMSVLTGMGKGDDRTTQQSMPFLPAEDIETASAGEGRNLGILRTISFVKPQNFQTSVLEMEYEDTPDGIEDHDREKSSVPLDKTVRSCVRSLSDLASTRKNVGAAGSQDDCTNAGERERLSRSPFAHECSESKDSRREDNYRGSEDGDLEANISPGSLPPLGGVSRHQALKQTKERLARLRWKESMAEF